MIRRSSDKPLCNKQIGISLKVVSLLMAGLALFALIYLVPYLFGVLIRANHEYIYWFSAWETVLVIGSLPIFCALVFAFIISGRIQKGNSFCVENVRLLRGIAILAMLDSVYFVIANVVMYFCGFNWTKMIFVSIIVAFFGIVLSIAFQAISVLTGKATEIKDENDLTI